MRGPLHLNVSEELHVMTQEINIVRGQDYSVESTQWSPRDLFEFTGGNTGNLAFRHAIRRCVASSLVDKNWIRDGASFSPAGSISLLPCANEIGPHMDHGPTAQAWSEAKGTLVAIGLGAQAPEASGDVSIPSGTLDWLQILRQRKADPRVPNMSLRGQYTAEQLRRIGFTHNDFVVLGCPSLFISPVPDLGRCLEQRWLATTPRNLGVAAGHPHWMHLLQVETRLGTLMRKHQQLGHSASYVVQDPVHAIAIARDDVADLDPTWVEAYRRVLCPDLAWQEALTWMRNTFNVFASIPEWMSHLRRFDFVVGARIHGVALALQAGVPGLCIAHDSRTLELCQMMGVPHIQHDAVPTNVTTEELWQLARIDGGSFDANRVSLASRMARFLASNGVRPSAALMNIAHSGTEQAATTLAPSAGPLRTSLVVLPEPISPNGAPHGFLEKYNARSISGWFANLPRSRSAVEIMINDQVIATVPVVTVRNDLQGALAGFEYVFPRGAAPTSVVKVAARLEGTDVFAQNSHVVTLLATANDREMVLLGKDNWLFLKNDNNRILDQITGKLQLSKENQQVWRSFSESLRALPGTGVQPFVLIVPNKECVLHEKLPEHIVISDKRPVFDVIGQMRTTWPESGDRVLYPLEVLQSSSDSLFTKGDTHWSDVGALAAAKAVRDMMVKHGVAVSDLAPGDRVLRYANADLLSKLGGSCVEPKACLKRSAPISRTWWNGQFNTGTRARYQRLGGHSSATLSVLFAHDSFGENLIPLLCDMFREVHTSWGAQIPRALIEELRPDVVLVERVERFLMQPSVLV